MAKKVTDKQVRDALEAVVAEFGKGTVYEKGPTDTTCLYARVDDHGCIVGEVALKLGATHKQLLSLTSVDDMVRGGANTQPADSVSWRARTGLEISSEALKYLRAAQRIQDDSGTWGDALDSARDYEGILNV